MRPDLPAPCRWLHFNDGGCGLYWHYGNIGMVTPQDGKWRTLVQWRGRTLYATAGSKEQGMRWVERWICAASDRDSLPTKPREVRRGLR